MKFYLGTHLWTWVTCPRFTGVPLFISNNSLKGRKSPFPPAQTDWALDSGGFTEIKMHGRWTVTPDDYLSKAQQYSNELGRLKFIAPMDWMCEPPMLERTGLCVKEHQERTVANFLDLRDRAPHLPIIPVLQGWSVNDYHYCVRLYENAGIDLTLEPTVGVGSVCRRQATSEIDALFRELDQHGLQLHGFGVKSQGLAKYGPFLSSSDSMAWSFTARYADPLPGCEGHKNCANCKTYALRWRTSLLSKTRAPAPLGYDNDVATGAAQSKEPDNYADLRT